jgi:F0F1-type ATP synthase membrane subunit c/vacuolar-type H+-ATPase subunit K
MKRQDIECTNAIESFGVNRVRKAPLGSVKAALGCGIILIFVTGIFGFVVSFFANDPELAATVRSRCLIGMAIGVVMVIAWIIYQSRE